jgi:uncharacterized protein (TIGR02246 family)
MNLGAIILTILAFQSSAAADAPSAIRNVLNVQLQAWNRGDVAKFVTTYAEDCTFVGKQILHGRSSVLARYQKAYPSPEAMGKLSFQNVDVHLLDNHFAIVTGEWHLDRVATAGGPIGGLFSLVLQLRGAAWQIVLDHSS